MLKLRRNRLEKHYTAIEQDSESCVRFIYENVKELTDNINKSDSAGIKSKNDKLLTEHIEVLSRWSEYIEELTTIQATKPQITEKMNG